MTPKDEPSNVTIYADDHDGHHPESPYVMIFLFGGLALGLSLQALLNSPWIKKHIRIPYTVAMLISGLLIGLLIQVVASAMSGSRGDWAFTTFTMANTNPHLIMYIFLPTLIFESAFKMESHAVFKAFSQILLLAVLGLLLAALLIAGCMYGMVTIGQRVAVWTFPVCMLFGSIMSATDPVAVVALLREVGAPKNIVIITEGESLFNDGAAIIAYELFLKVSERSLLVFKSSTSTTAADDAAALEALLWEIARIIGGMIVAPLIGLTGGKICEILLKNTFNNEIREKGIILITVYATFFVSEELKVSGVLAIVVLGVWISYHKPSISPEAMEDNNKFWDFFSYWANTLVFILTGLVISKPIYRNTIQVPHHVVDYLYTIVVYFVINIARGVSILILYPILSRIGYGLPWKNYIVLVWGGLRGAIALLLALQLLEEPSLKEFSQEIGEKVLLYVSGAVALTLLINATTFNLILNRLRMNQIPEHQLKVMRNILQYLSDVQKNAIAQLKDDRFLADADWDLVTELTTLHNPYHGQKEATLSEKKKEQLRRAVEAIGRTGLVADRCAATLEEARLRVLQVEKVSYWRQFAKGLLSIRAIHTLSDAVEETIDKPGAVLEVDKFRRSWKLSSFYTFAQAVLSKLFAYDRRAVVETSLRQPRTPYCRVVLLGCTSSVSFNFFVYLLVVAHSILIVFEMCFFFDGASERARFAVLIAKYAFYSFFIAETLLKLFAETVAGYFRRHENKFDFVFCVLYAVNLFNLLTLHVARPDDLLSMPPETGSRPQNSTLAAHPLPLVFSNRNRLVFEGLLLGRLLKLLHFVTALLPRLMSVVDHKIHQQVGLAYDTAKGYIVGEEETNKHIDRLIEDPAIAHDTMERSRRSRLEAIKFLARLQVEQPGAAISVKTKQAARYCLNQLHDNLNEMRDSGIVDEKEYALLHKSLEEHILQVRHAPPWINPPSLEKRLRHLGWINDNEELVKFIVDNGELRQFAEKEIVYRQGAKADGLYILASGMMVAKVEPNGAGLLDEYLYPGRYFGEMCVVTSEPRMRTIVAEVDSATYFIPQKKIRAALEQFHDVYWLFVHAYCINKVVVVLQSHPAFAGWTDAKLRGHVTSNGEFVDLHLVEKYRRKTPGEALVLVRGAVRDAKTVEKVVEATNYQSCLVPPEIQSVLVAENTRGVVWLFAVPPVHTSKMRRTVTRLFLDATPRRHSVVGVMPTRLFEETSSSAMVDERSSSFQRDYGSADEDDDEPFAHTEQLSFSLPANNELAKLLVLARKQSLRNQSYSEAARAGLRNRSASNETWEAGSSVATAGSTWRADVVSNGLPSGKGPKTSGNLAATFTIGKTPSSEHISLFAEDDSAPLFAQRRTFSPGLPLVGAPMKNGPIAATRSKTTDV